MNAARWACALVIAITSLQAAAGTEGANSTYYGSGACQTAAEANVNTCIGRGAGYGIVSGNSGVGNVFLGTDTGLDNSSGSYNVIAGHEAGSYNSTGSWNVYLGADAGFRSNTSSNNTFVGGASGVENTVGAANTFLGYSTGNKNTTGTYGTFVGSNAGNSNTTGQFNSAIGTYAGYANTTGGYNSYFGAQSGQNNVSGSGNVFIGNAAGYTETGSNKLYIDNCMNGAPCTPPFIYGEFDNHLLKINGVMHVSANGASKSQLHFSLNNADSGGFLTSVLENNFFMSSGARWDAAAGGWVQRSSDQQAVIQGSGSLGYRVFTSSAHAVGSTFTPTVRLHIDYNGSLGLNTAAVAGTPIMHSSGAHLTAGGVWTDASSREYKEHVQALDARDALLALIALKPVRYNYKIDPAERHVGFIAEDVPELVATPDRTSLSPMDIVAVLTKVVQEQERVLEEKSRTVDEQRSLLISMEAKMARMEKDLEYLKGSFSVTAR